MTSELATSLALARKKVRMTQAELAERAGLSRMAVQRTETGDVDPRFSTLKEMARVLDMDLIAVPAALRPQIQALLLQPLEPANDGAQSATPAPLDGPALTLDAQHS